jgi:predicted dehydrogenase
MKQIFQSLSSGDTEVLNVPCPQPKSGEVLIATTTTLVSVGTERMLVDFGKAGLLQKAMSQPDKVKMVLEKTKTDGLIATYDAVKSKLDQPLPLGYCNVGVVVDGVGSGFEPGSRVISNGSHAEMVRVPKNLVAAVPEEVDDETASFTVVAAIAMQGIRLINPSIGESVVVTGLGLIGLLAVQILKANGCRVLGIDIDPAKCKLAREFGAETVDIAKGQDPIAFAELFSRGRGVDAVLITASSKSNDIVHQAAIMSRKRGRIVLVGVVGLELSRADFYEKELSFQVSCSYGPGRYDDEYEGQGRDYPFAFVRWTEQRNFEAILDLMATGEIDIKTLISAKFSIDDAVAAYDKLNDPGSLGILLEFGGSDRDVLLKKTVKLRDQITKGDEKGNISFIGGGNYASRVLIPAFARAGASLIALVTSGGFSAVHHGQKNSFSMASTDIEEALTESTDAVVIATRHNIHGSQAVHALEKGKHVFVEKPLALTHDEIDRIEASQKVSGKMVMVGYNRRFSPLTIKMKELLNKKAGPKTFIMTMNAGEIPKDHWTQDVNVGGGRIIGEACHFIDLMRFLTGSKIESFNAVKIGFNDHVVVTEDKAIITLTFEDGSIGSIHYFANGGKSFPKERVEVFCDNAVLQLDNFRKLTGFGWKGFSKLWLWSQDKGQLQCSAAFMDAVRGSGISPIPINETFEVARISLDIAAALRQ